jgi:hypothetical protein
MAVLSSRSANRGVLNLVCMNNPEHYKTLCGADYPKFLLKRRNNLPIICEYLVVFSIRSADRNIMYNICLKIQNAVFPFSRM